METGAEQYISQYPGPEDLWNIVFAQENAWRDRFAAIPFEDKGGTWQARYYQHNAIENTLEAVANGRKRILLTLATGTGKTFIAFQPVWGHVPLGAIGRCALVPHSRARGPTRKKCQIIAPRNCATLLARRRGSRRVLHLQDLKVRPWIGLASGTHMPASAILAEAGSQTRTRARAYRCSPVSYP
jgi:hypothetical protein